MLSLCVLQDKLYSIAFEVILKGAPTFYVYATILKKDNFFRLMSPEASQKSSLFPRLGSKFRYSGRTHYETKKTLIDRPAPQFERSLTGRRLTSRSMDRKHFNK